MHDVDGDTESVKAMHGTVHYEAVHGFLECAARRDVRSAVNVISALWPDGNGLGVLVQLTANILESLAFTRHVNREGAL
jgi:DNA polymerase III gamma/tau subunit